MAARESVASLASGYGRRHTAELGPLGPSLLCEGGDDQKPRLSAAPRRRRRRDVSSISQFPAAITANNLGVSDNDCDGSVVELQRASKQALIAWGVKTLPASPGELFQATEAGKDDVPGTQVAVGTWVLQMVAKAGRDWVCKGAVDPHPPTPPHVPASFEESSMGRGKKGMQRAKRKKRGQLPSGLTRSVVRPGSQVLRWAIVVLLKSPSRPAIGHFI